MKLFQAMGSLEFLICIVMQGYGQSGGMDHTVWSIHIRSLIPTKEFIAE